MDIDSQPLAVSSQSTPTIAVGVDDGYAYTKLALPDGRLLATPSRAQIGRCNVSWLNQTERRIFEYETEGTVATRFGSGSPIRRAKRARTSSTGRKKSCGAIACGKRLARRLAIPARSAASGNGPM